MSKDIGALYVKVYNLRKKRAKLIQEIKEITQNRKDISLQYNILASDLMQEVGFSNDEFHVKSEQIYQEEIRLDNLEYELEYKLNQVNHQLSNIHKVSKDD